MADENKSLFRKDILKNIANRLPYQTPDAKELLGNLNPKYNDFENTGVRRTEALANQSIFYNNEYK